MYTFFIQLIDLFVEQKVGLFMIFFLLSWMIYFLKLLAAATYSPTQSTFTNAVSIIIPVVDEKMEVWATVLDRVKIAAAELTNEIIVVANGAKSDNNATYAESIGLRVVRITEPSKRKAILEASKLVQYPITIILDSDTIATKDSIKELLKPFANEKVGGATPRHLIFNPENILTRRISDWLEDIRFNEVLKGQSVTGAVSCLPGRMFAIRTQLLLDNAECLASQTFLGNKCISGDDRYLTSCILKAGYKTVYQSTSIVLTDCPNDIKGFVKQRLRWSRTSMRETILSIPWIFKHKFTAFTVLSNVFMRWLFLIVLLHGVQVWTGLIHEDHIFYSAFPQYYTPLAIGFGVGLGFIASGLIRHLRHLWSFPKDILYLIPFLFITTFILTPTEWVGNLTLRESGWMTRDTK